MEHANTIDDFFELRPTLAANPEGLEQRPLSWYWCSSLTPRHKETLARLGLQPVRLVRHMVKDKQEVAGVFHKHERVQRQVNCLVGTPHDLHKEANKGGRRVRFLSNVRGNESGGLLMGYESMDPTSTKVHVDLSSLELHALLAESIPVVDIVTYEMHGVQRFALVTDTSQPSTFVLTGATGAEINSWLLQTRLVLKLVRCYLEKGETKFIAVARRSSIPRWSWVANVSSDTLSNRLRSQGAYLVDLDVSCDPGGRTKFSGVFYRWKQ
jgi:hypothetical protein